MKNETIQEKFARNAYRPTLPFYTGTSKEARDSRDAYRNEEARLYHEFKKDVLEALELTDHPKAELLFEMAWRDGHASGYEEVWYHAQDLATLLK